MITRVPAPRINTNDDQVGVVQWHVKDGDLVAKGADLIDLETSKAVVTLSAERDGYVHCLVSRGQIIRVGTDLCTISDDPAEPTQGNAAPNVTAGLSAPLDPRPEPAISGHSVQEALRSAEILPERIFSQTRFSREAERLLGEAGLSTDAFKGSGLVTARMVRDRLNPAGKVIGKGSSNRTHIANRSKGNPRSGPIVPREESVSLAKRAEITQLSTGESGQINSTLTVHFASAAIRARLAASGDFDGNIQPLILYELARLLLQWPQLTAYYEADQIHYYDRIDLGLAMDMGKGLKVIRIQDAETLTPADLFARTIDFGLRYMDNQIRPEELVGSTITVTDLSGLDVLHFRPLINGRQSAILGIGGDCSQTDFPMTLNLSFDHRVTNGREVALFLKDLRARILSYAPAAPLSLSATSGASSPRCETCGIDYPSYVQQYGRGAYLLAALDAQGKLTGVCHRCYSGWN